MSARILRVILLAGPGLQFCNLCFNFLLDIKYNIWFTVAVLAVVRLLIVTTRNKSSCGLDNADSVGVLLELACASRKSFLIHTRYDTISLLDKAGL